MFLALLACAPHPVALTPAPSRVDAPAGPASAELSDWRTSVVADLALAPDDAYLGPENARFTLVSYTDFFCPHCAAFWPKLVALQERTPDLKVVAKNWPIDRACNPLVQSDRHSFACLAARAAECANRQRAFPAMADLLFSQPEHVTPTEIPWYADQAHIDREQFMVCLADPSIEASVRADVQSGIDAEIMGTPSVFLGGIEPGVWVQVTPDLVVVEQVLAAARRGALPR
jgi:protein-disulfide isomerase